MAALEYHIIHGEDFLPASALYTYRIATGAPIFALHVRTRVLLPDLVSRSQTASFPPFYMGRCLVACARNAQKFSGKKESTKTACDALLLRVL